VWPKPFEWVTSAGSFQIFRDAQFRYQFRVSCFDGAVIVWWSRLGNRKSGWERFRNLIRVESSQIDSEQISYGLLS
jgi:hypothetical protein